MFASSLASCLALGTLACSSGDGGSGTVPANDSGQGPGDALGSGDGEAPADGDAQQTVEVLVQDSVVPADAPPPKDVPVAPDAPDLGQADLTPETAEDIGAMPDESTVPEIAADVAEEFAAPPDAEDVAAPEDLAPDATAAGDVQADTGPACQSDAECSASENPCEVVTCQSNACVAGPRDEGFTLQDGVSGDCQKPVCDGKGGSKDVPEDADVPDDQNPCTTDACLDGKAVSSNVAAGEPCGTGAMLCDGNGQCVGCLAAGDCPGTDGFCGTRTCTEGLCGVDAKPAGTALPDQPNGDCKVLQCDGKGTEVEVNDDADVTDDGNACTADLCQGGVASHPNKTDDTPCDDKDACTTVDLCKAGTCTGTAPVTCNAADVCHAAGTCDTATGVCSTPAQADGTSCDDGDGCTQTDTCEAGVCKGSNPLICKAVNTCHEVGVCEAATGTCTNPNKADGTACDDANACTQSDTCQAGACTGDNPLICKEKDQCHGVGVCDPGTGVCSDPVIESGVGCDDGDACTQADTCQAGACTGSNPVVCKPLDACHDAGSCDPLTGKCSDPTKADGVACSDANACTQVDACQGGVCTGSDQVVCQSLDACHDVGVCDPVTGKCSNPALSGGPCDDGDACTQTDTCAEGNCTGGNAVTCTPLDDCHVLGKCDPLTGKCSDPPAPDGTACDKNNLCALEVSCQAGKCSGAYMTCTPTDECHAQGTCSPDTGLCSFPPLDVGTPCSGGFCDADGACNPSPTVASVKHDWELNKLTVTFDMMMSVSTLTAQAAAGTCSESIQVSSDGFKTCIGWGLVQIGGGNDLAMLSQPTPPPTPGYKYVVRVTSAAKGGSAIPVQGPLDSPPFYKVPPPAGCGAGVVVSQVYGGGGNSGSIYSNDFIELHNRGPLPVTVSGYAVQYASASGSTWSVTPLTGTIQPGAFYLVQEAAGTGGTTKLPFPEVANGTIAMAAGAGKVALTSSTTPLTGTCPTGTAILDLVAYGTGATCAEGGVIAPAPSATLSVSRKDTSCQDTNVNGDDFIAAGVVPHNGTFAPVKCMCVADQWLNELDAEAEMNYCIVQSPKAIVLPAGNPTGPLYGRVYEPQMTEAGGQNPLIIAELGYGPAGSDPRLLLGWSWFPGAYNIQTGNDDEYVTAIDAPKVKGQYGFVWRFSTDGASWTYCDSDGAGSNANMTFDEAKIPPMVVQ